MCAAPSALASERLTDRSVGGVTLRVDASGRALVSYAESGRGRRHVLVSGAVDALPPQARPQVRFTLDYGGGRRLSARGAFRDHCRPYDGPDLAWLVAACKAPDGSYWALQRWQRSLPLLGVAPWLESQRGWDLRVSHWRGATARLDAAVTWTPDGRSNRLFGRLTYAGVPVYGFASTSTGVPLDRYGRNVYIDTLGSAYGPGWARENGALTHTGTGTFCYAFLPRAALPGYPDAAPRPAGNGSRYRLTVIGPGMTPDVTWEGAGLGAFDGRSPHDVASARKARETFAALMAGDRLCRP